MKEEGMNGREIEFIPDRLIEEPVVFRGLNDTEIVYIAVGGVLFWIPLCVLLLLPFGGALFGVGIGFALTILTLVLAGNYLQNLKRRMPDGLHLVYLKKLAQKKFSFINFGYIEETQVWDIRREKPVEKIHFETED
jgi:conjugative transfer region protein (TIGR03750 family)